MDLDPKGANNQIKEVIDRQYANDDDEVVVCLDSVEDSSSAGGGASTAAGSGAQARRRTNSQYEPMDADTDDNLSLVGSAEVSI